MVPRTVLTRSGLISLNTARPINIVQSRTAVNNAGLIKIVINNAYSTARRPFNKITAANNNNFTKKINTVKGIRVNTARPKAVLSTVKGTKLESGTFTSIFKYPALKQLAIKRGDEYGFFIRLYLVGVTFESVRIDL
ncbi:hypothetical protein Tco_0551329 [Tanacetum coccineum]